MHGVGVKYCGSYDEEQLLGMARRATGFMGQGYDTFVYFNNDAHAHAVENALELRRLVECLVRRDDAQRSNAPQEAG